jgi:hypothetical protein
MAPFSGRPTAVSRIIPENLYSFVTVIKKFNDRTEWSGIGNSPGWAYLCCGTTHKMVVAGLAQLGNWQVKSKVGLTATECAEGRLGGQEFAPAIPAYTTSM